MRSFKTSGGLTHGSGMNEEQRSLWTMSMPVTAMYIIAMQDFNNFTYTTSDQHKETTEARLNRDIHDLAKINSRLIPFTPFSEDCSLRNIVTGIEALSDTNVHECKAVGMNIITTMVSQAAFQYSFKCMDRAWTFVFRANCPRPHHRSRLVVSEIHRRIPNRWSLHAGSDEARAQYIPTHLVWARHIFREADKPQIATAITEHASSVTSDEYDNVTTSLMEGPCCIECHGKLETVIGLLHSHMQILACVIMA